MFSYKYIEDNLKSKYINAVYSQYQPIVSINKEKIIGFEGLSRGIDNITGNTISPEKMFREAADKGSTIYLDRMCRDVCLNGFRESYNKDNDLHLFINIDASIIELVNGSNYLYKQVQKNFINPENVIIEINESKVKNTAALIEFVQRYRKFGFIIALDDVGNGFSNLERISIVKPDIVKIDKSLVLGIENSYYKQEIFKCLISLSNKVGAITIAEGIETINEVRIALEYGAHLLQGYFFAKPNYITKDSIELINSKIKYASISYKGYIQNQLKKEKKNKRDIGISVNNIKENLEKINKEKYNEVLEQFIKDNKLLNIECCYILNTKGIQISDTVFGHSRDNIVKKFIFYPATMGKDNSNKPYYYELVNQKMNLYVSEPYISHATGNVCKTISTMFKTSSNENNIICIDVMHETE